MRHLIADLIDKLNVQEASSQEACVQLGAIQLIVMAMFNRLDEQSRQAIHENITLSFEKISDEELSDPDDLQRLRSAIFALLNRERYCL
ncbi:MAG: sigma-S stabilization anti-adapter protein IraP [Pseudescherichia vulneris]|nr:sigma-S stabilization anti-adapter protein IraP [Pseudescherichia vulneris]